MTKYFKHGDRVVPVSTNLLRNQLLRKTYPNGVEVDAGDCWNTDSFKHRYKWCLSHLGHIGDPCVFCQQPMREEPEL